jgi:glutamate-1-semialdehyde 2,1-aminomutase
MYLSELLFEQAQLYIPGGVNSSVRSFKGVGGTPIFFDSAQGPYLYDEDNRRYIDYMASWGPMILGHQDPDVVAAMKKQLDKAVSFGAPTKVEVQLAQLICENIPFIEQIRMVNSGTEATMTALRLARGHTGRDLIIKFEGCYHGHSDSLLVKAGSGALTLGQPSSAGVPADIAKHTLNLEFNNIPALQKAFADFGDQIAAIILEPIPGNMGCILPDPQFLRALRQGCNDVGAVLIFDEVISGFRVAFGGAQALYGVQPDLVTFGKIIGGGMPVGALGGKKEIMQKLAPVGPVYQAGTLSGNPVAMTAGLATLGKILSQPDFYIKLQQITETVVTGFENLAKKHEIPMVINWVTGMFGLFFTEQPKVQSYTQVLACDVERFKRFYHGMLSKGIYFGPSAFESGFVSIVHDQLCIEETLQAADQVFASLR